MGNEEGIACSALVVDVGGHDVEAGVLEVEIGIDVDDGIIAHLHAGGLVLYAILSDDGAIGGAVIFGEIAEVGTQLGQEDFGKTEFEVEIGVGVEGGHGQHILVGRHLIGQGVLPVEDAPAEILIESDANQTDILGVLLDGHAVQIGVGGCIGHGRGLLLEVEEVLDGLEVEVDARLSPADIGFHVSAKLLVESLVVPPRIAGVVVAIVEGTRIVAHKAAHLQTEGVAPQGNIERAVALNVELAPLLARRGEFAQHVEAEDAAHGLEQLSSHTDAVLVVLLGAGGEMWQCELVAVEVVAGKESEASLHPRVKTFAEFEGHGVGYVQVLGIVVGGIAR